MSEALTREIEELRLLMGSPRDPHGRVFAQLGDALRRAGSHREALTVLLDGVTEHPNFSPGHLVLGWTAQQSGDLTVARTAFERTLELDPENPNGLFGLGTLLDREGSPRGAQLIEEAESLDAEVGARAPRTPEGAPEATAAPGGGDPALEHLPFLSLEEMAPDMTLDEGQPAAPLAADEALFGLPFISLEELAPDAGETNERGGDEADDSALTLDALPFVSLEELRPDAAPVPAAEDAEPDPDDVDEELDLAGPLATRTMGELLVRQGLTAQAVEVFETLVERSPEDAGLQDRLEELRAELEGAGEAASAEADDATPSASESHEASSAEEAGTEKTSLADLHESAAHPSMDPPVPHPEVPSPFQPDTGDADDRAEDEGEGVGEYFSRLLAWSPGASEAPGDSGGSQGEESDGS